MVGSVALQTSDGQRALRSTVRSIIALKASFDPKEESLPFFITYLNEGRAGREMVVVATVDATGMLQLLLQLLLRQLLQLLSKGR